MALFSSIAFFTATRLGYKLAEKKKWLPKTVYNHLALDKLKQGDIQAAARFNRVVLQKHPDDEQALVVKDLILMHRDTKFYNLKKHIAGVEEELRRLKTELIENQRTIRRNGVQKRWLLFLSWLLLLLNVALYFVSFFVATHFERPIVGGILGACSVLGTLFLVRLVKRHHDQSIMFDLNTQELEASLKSIQRQIEIREKTLRELKSQFTEFKYHYREIK